MGDALVILAVYFVYSHKKNFEGILRTKYAKTVCMSVQLVAGLLSAIPTMHMAEATPIYVY